MLWLCGLLAVALAGAAVPPRAQVAEEPPSPPLSAAPSEADLLRRLTTEPDNPSHYLALARRFIERGEPQRVATLIVPAAERWMGRGEYAAAATVLDLAVEVEPENARFWALLGSARALNRQFRAAEPALRRAVDLGHPDLRTVLVLSSAVWENGSPEAAEELLLEARAVHGDSLLIDHHLGSLRVWQGRFAEAIAELERVVASRPRWIGARLDLARALDGAGRSAEARQQFETYLEVVPGDAGARYGLATALMALGERESAAEQMRIYGEIRERERQDLLVEGRLESALDEAIFLINEGRAAEAVEQLDRLPRNVNVLEVLSRALTAEGELLAAVTALEEALALDPSRLDLRLRLQDLRTEARDTP